MLKTNEPKPRTIFTHPNFVHLREWDRDDMELWKAHHQES